LLDLNAVKAYQRAYPDAKYDSARASVHKLLANASIRDQISLKLEESREMLGISREKVLNEYKLIAFSNIYDFIDVQLSEITLRPESELNEAQKRTVKELKIESTYNHDSKETTTKTTLKLYDKIKALDKLSEYTLLMSQNNEVENNKIEFISKDDLNG
jgi:hypothetical protein